MLWSFELRSIATQSRNPPVSERLETPVSDANMVYETPSKSLEDVDREAILEAVRERELSSDVDAVVTEYENRVGDRDLFLWKWVHSVLDSIQLSSVDTRPKAVTDTSTITTMLVSLYDDLLEKHGDYRSFDRAFSIPFRHESPDIERDWDALNGAYLDCIQKVWSVLDARLRNAPRHDEFRRLFEYDFRQVLDSIEYSVLVSDTPEIANLQESTIHECHNMTMFVYADIDLMHSREFDRAELGTVRRAIWHGQQMARIGNWLSTWERELEEGDYSSGVVVRSLEENTIGPDDLRGIDGDPDADRLDRLRDKIRTGGAEEQLTELWKQQQHELRQLEADVDSIDLGQFLDGLDLVFKYHLASKGLK